MPVISSRLLSIIHLIVLFGICLYATSFALDNTEFHSTITIIDDITIVYANLMKYPDIYEHDVISLAGQAPLYGSIINWGSGVVWLAGVTPEASYFFLVFLQSFMLGISGYVLTLRITGQPLLALFATLFLYAVQPWSWNIAQFVTVFPTVYGQQVAISASMLSFAAWLYHKYPAALVLGVLSGLIHPIIGGCTLVVLGLVWLSQLLSQPTLWRYSIGFILAGVLLLLPSTIVNLSIQEPIAEEVVLARFKANYHLAPFHNLMDNVYAVAFFEWVLLVILSLPGLQHTHSTYPRFLGGLALATILLSISQYLGVEYDIAVAMQLTGTRSNILFVLGTLPLVLAYTQYLMVQRSGVGLLAMVLLLHILANDSLGFPRPVLVVLAIINAGYLAGYALARPWLNDVSQGLAGIVLLIWLLHFTGVYTNIVANVFEPISAQLAHQTTQIVLYAILIVLPLWWVMGRYKRDTRLYIGVMMFSVLLAISTYLIWTVNRLQAGHHRSFMASQEYVDLHAAQIWARENTAPDAFFVGPEVTWRGTSQRPYLYLYPRAWYLYLLDNRLYEQQQSVLAWLGYSDGSHGRFYPPFTTFQLLNSQDFWAMHHVEHVTHAVRGGVHRRPDSVPQSLDFAQVYANESVHIYDLRQPQSDAMTAVDLAVQERWYDSVPDGGGYMLDASYGLNSLRPHIVLGYVPDVRRQAHLADPYALDERTYLAGIWETEYSNVLLRNLQIEYVYVDHLWWQSASQTARDALQSPAKFEERWRLGDQDAWRALYYVNQTPLPEYPEDFLPTDVLEQAVLMQLYENWPFRPSSDVRILLPRDNRGLGLVEHFSGVSLPEDFSASVAPDIEAWQSTKAPEYLRAANIEYLFFDHIWWGYLTEAERLRLQDPQQYEVVQEWRFGEGELSPFFRLLRIGTPSNP